MVRLMSHKGSPTWCVEHGAGVIDAPDRDVLVGGAGHFVAADGDPCPCAAGAPNVVMAGMTEILVHGIPVSGLWHPTAHNTAAPDAANANIAWGDTWVLMGGGMTVGNVAAATAACELLPKGRQNGSANQSGQNCGVESMRQIINAKRRRDGLAPLSEDELLDETLKHGDSYVTVDKGDKWDATLIEKDRQIDESRARLAAARQTWESSKKDVAAQNAWQKAQREHKDAVDRASVDPSGALIGTETELKQMASEARERQRKRAEAAAGTKSFSDPARREAGGTLPDQQRRVLDRHGIATDEVPQDPSDPEHMKQLEGAVGRGQGVLVGVHAGPLWGTGDTGGHAVLVTGVEYDAQGNVVGYVTNDTAKGCGRRVTRDQLRGALKPELKATVTRDPIW
jgi:hypothetical protein